MVFTAVLMILSPVPALILINDAQCVCFCLPQSQLRSHEKEHDNLSSDTAATDGMTTIKEAEQEIAGTAPLMWPPLHRRLRD